ncbi:MAG: AGE family epimerase/isomerase [Propionibacteriaceae bacterium]|jgi:mannose/cellobiose epimerase-like protein (N-acyl-D-glucosamine 2-epimerase family)|nr:AGE family epimerase/isomerase [Propionibacteriaceae bacterium]
MDLHNETLRLLDFALGSVCEEGGFGWLDDTGQIDRTQDRQLWINCRMTHVAAIGTLLNHPGCREALDHGVTALTTLFADPIYGGWYDRISWDGQPIDDTKAAYAHAFVILAASSAVAAGSTKALPLFQEALTISTTRFWDETQSMSVEEWDRSFSTLSTYRGVNANMHTVEAYLAAADVIDLVHLSTVSSDLLRVRAHSIMDRIVNREARANQWRIPEHFDEIWTSDLEYNRNQPADPFRPFGATIGHGLEWARLAIQTHGSITDPPEWMLEGAKALYERAVDDGWEVDGTPGFIYTSDWDGHPVVHERMHWVLAEAIGASIALDKARILATSQDCGRWWDYADTYLIDYDNGSWHHELDQNNRPSCLVWTGKPDVYHALQATLFSRLPVVPAIVPALARGLITS